MDEFTAEAFALLAVGLFVIGVRTHARLTTVGLKGLQADDYIMLLAAVVYSVETYLAYSVGAFWHGLANNAMTDEQRAALAPDSPEFALRVAGSKTQVAGWSTYTLLLWMLKAAMCTFYLRLTDGLDMLRSIYFGFVLIVVTWIIVFLSIVFGCHPMEKNWQIYPDPGNHCQPAISKIDIFVTVVLNVVTDVYLLSIPMPMLWNSSLKPARKLGLMVLFSGGIFVTMAGILRCVLIVTNPVTGAQQAGSWACRETFVAVVTSNLPMVFPVARRWTAPLVGSLVRTTRSVVKGSSHTDPAGRSGRSGVGGGGGGGDVAAGQFVLLEDKNPRRGLGPRSVNPITNFTMDDGPEDDDDDEDEMAHDTLTLTRKTPASSSVSRHGSPAMDDDYDEGDVVDLEAQTGGAASLATGGGITKETSVHVSSLRGGGEGDRGHGAQTPTADYYLRNQSGPAPAREAP